MVRRPWHPRVGWGKRDACPSCVPRAPPRAGRQPPTDASVPAARAVHELLKYEFDLEFDIPVTYPQTAPELQLPELDGKTAKMYRGGKICLSIHFQPLWARNVPRFGIAHLLALGLGPWLAAEVPHLVDAGLIDKTD